MSFCIIDKGRVIHPSYIPRSIGVGGLEITGHTGYTPFGYVIPMGPDGYNVIDYLENGVVYGEFSAVIIDQTGNVYEILGSDHKESGGVKRRRLPFDDVLSTFVKAGNLNVEKHILTGLHIGHNTVKIMETMQKINQVQRFAFDKPHVLVFDEIIVNLRKLNPKRRSVPIPNQKD